jgi:hypothetical protein
LLAKSWDGICWSSSEGVILIADEHGDELVGTDHDDVLLGSSGNDLIWGVNTGWKLAP